MAIVQPGSRRAQEIPYLSSTGRIYAWAELDGVLQNPTSATVNIYRQGEVSTPTVSAGAVTELGTNQLYHTLDASQQSTWPLNMLGLAEFICVITSQPDLVVRRSFRIVRVPMVHVPPCRIDELKNAHMTVEDALTNAGITDITPFIIEAWEKILGWVEQEKMVPGFISNPEDLAPMLRALARARMFRALKRATDGDLYTKLQQEYEDEYADILVHPPVLHYAPADDRSTTPMLIGQPRIGISERSRRLP